MSENKHYDEAAHVGPHFADGSLNTDADYIAVAQVEATLALAYEQRTANLIALWSNPQSRQEDMNGNPMIYSINSDTPGKVIEQILERLDLP